VERKVSKAQTLQTSIPGTVTVILEPTSTSVSTPPLALRLSGQLLLGIARIYSKQTKYLLEDCNEAFEKIRAAFKTDGIQTLFEDQI
ncbi:Rad21/Rec8-like protein, partial [Phakopsora pachyrhizi]